MSHRRYFWYLGEAWQRVPYTIGVWTWRTPIKSVCHASFTVVVHTTTNWISHSHLSRRQRPRRLRRRGRMNSGRLQAGCAVLLRHSTRAPSAASENIAAGHKVRVDEACDRAFFGLTGGRSDCGCSNWKRWRCLFSRSREATVAFLPSCYPPSAWTTHDAVSKSNLSLRRPGGQTERPAERTAASSCVRRQGRRQRFVSVEQWGGGGTK